MRFNLPSRERFFKEGKRPEKFKFVNETISELRKVHWPSREEATRLTTVVVIVAVAMGILLGLVDLVFSRVANVLFFS